MYICAHIYIYIHSYIYVYVYMCVCVKHFHVTINSQQIIISTPSKVL